MNRIKKIAGFLSLPITLTIVAYILFFNSVRLSESLISALQYMSYILFIVGILLGIRFNKSKVFFLSLILGSFQYLLANSSHLFHAINNELSDITDILSLLIPINIFLFSMLKERGILTVWGKLKFAFLIAQALIIRLLLDPSNNDMREILSHELISFTDSMPIPQISVLLFIILVLYLVIRFFLNPALIDSTLLCVTVLALSCLMLKDRSTALNLFFTMMGLILVLGVVETSHSMAYKDQLTGLPSRRALEESMLKLGSKYTIAMVDIDHFKKFNDTYGHDAGDGVLQMVASNLAKIGLGGKAFRFGGEEFTILFANKAMEEVLPELEELRKNIAKQKHAYKRKTKVKGTNKSITRQLSVTISIGVAEKCDKYKAAEEVRKASDKALYKSKKNGRNCVSK